jgi:putative colanic acid biosynthesis glycosyltransferase
MKKILIINTTLNKGGAARVAYTLFKDLQNSFDLYFAYGRGAVSKEKNTFYFGNKLEFLLHVFIVRFLGLEGFGSYFSTRKLISFIRKEKFDVVNIHNLHGYYVNFFQLLSFLNKENIKIVYSLHDEWAMNCILAHSMGCAHCRTGRGGCSSNYTYPKTLHNIFNKTMLNKKKKIFLNIDNLKIVCPSKSLAKEVEKTFLNKFNINVVSNGVDVNIFKPANDKASIKEKYGFPADSKVVVFASASLKDKNKGINFILELSKKLPAYFFLGIGAGKFPKEYINIFTTGYINNKLDLADAYSAGDVFLSTSLAETFSLTTAESMSSGVPVVAFDTPVLRELVKNNSGIIVSKNTDDLRRGVLEILSDEDKKINFGINAREFILENFSQNKFISDYKNIFNLI